jgi:hypothetical protein
MFKNKNKKIRFISTIEGLESIEECLPRPAKYFIPQWFKDIPNSDPMTVKVCPSFPDYFSQGYIVPMWTDVRLKIEGNDWSWETATDQVKWDIHNNNQFLDYTNASFNGIDGQFVFKAICPWRVITPPGWSLLQLPLFYHFNKDWSILPGVTDTDIDSEINQQVLYHGNGKEILIKKGDPFVLYIPFKRSEKLKLEIGHQTKKDKKNFIKDAFNINSSFRPNGHYRSLQRKRDKDLK